MYSVSIWHYLLPNHFFPGSQSMGCIYKTWWKVTISLPLILCGSFVLEELCDWNFFILCLWSIMMMTRAKPEIMLPLLILWNMFLSNREKHLISINLRTLDPFKKLLVNFLKTIQGTNPCSLLVITYHYLFFSFKLENKNWKSCFQFSVDRFSK